MHLFSDPNIPLVEKSGFTLSPSSSTCAVVLIHQSLDCLVFQTVWLPDFLFSINCLFFFPDFQTVWFTKLFGFSDCQIYHIVWFSRLCGLPDCLVFQTVWFTTLFGFPDRVVYQSVWFSRHVVYQIVWFSRPCGGLPDCLVFHSVWFTRLFGFQVRVVYQIVWFSNLLVLFVLHLVAV